MAWEFLRPILTPNALATVQANPILLAYFLMAFFTVIVVMSIAFAIHFQTSKAYKKPKKNAGKGAPAGKGGAAGKAKGLLSSVRAKVRI